MNELTPFASPDPNLVTVGQIPALITASGVQAETRFWEFFTVTIRMRCRFVGVFIDVRPIELSC